MVWYGIGTQVEEEVSGCVCVVPQRGRSSGVSVRYTNGGEVLVCLYGTPMVEGLWCVCVVH